MFNRAVVLCLVGMLSACGGGSTSPNAPAPPPTTQPAATASRITVGLEPAIVTITSTTQVGRLLLKCGDFSTVVVFTESAGLAATITTSDVYLRELDGDISGRRATDRSDRIPAGGSIRVGVDRFECGYQDRDWPMVMVGSWTVRDDRGNVFPFSVESGFVER